MHRIHLDTDFGGDTDDLCALALALGWPDTTITGITTTADKHGYRRAYVEHVLQLAGRDDIPVASGAKVTLSDHKQADPIMNDERYWPIELPARLSEPYDAIQLMERSMFKDATLISIGPLTNVAMFDRVRSGLMRNKRVVFMGGYPAPPEDGLPAWGQTMDFNVQWDVRAAEELLKTWALLTMVPLGVSLKAQLTERDCAALESTGPVGALVARQSRAHADDHNMHELARVHAGLEDDLLNFQYDPLTVATALGWDGVTTRDMTLMPFLEDGVMRWEESPEGRAFTVVTDVDGPAFREMFVERVSRLSHAR